MKTFRRMNMKSLKTILYTTAVMTSFAFTNVSANGFFSVEKQSYQQPDTFNEAPHKGTTFWSYYNKDLVTKAPKIDRVASFDASKHVGTTFWGVYSN